jgi:hypothetical protein
VKDYPLSAQQVFNQAYDCKIEQEKCSPLLSQKTLAMSMQNHSARDYGNQKSACHASRPPVREITASGKKSPF